MAWAVTPGKAGATRQRLAPADGLVPSENPEALWAIRGEPASGARCNSSVWTGSLGARPSDSPSGGRLVAAAGSFLVLQRIDDQVLEVMVAITTNEPVQRLHPAIVRPGRCLAEVFIGPLARPEALRWLGRSEGVESEGATLAELFLLRGQLHKVERRGVAALPGQYF